MSILTTKTYRVIDHTKAVQYLQLRVAATGGVEFNGMISAVTSGSITVTGRDDNNKPVTAKFSAKQLHENDYDKFLITQRLIIDGTVVYSESEDDFTVEKTDTIFDVTAARPNQFAQWTVNGTTYYNGVVRAITETSFSMYGQKNSISLAEAQSPNFSIVFADDLGGGGSATLTILGED